MVVKHPQYGSLLCALLMRVAARWYSSTVARGDRLTDDTPELFFEVRASFASKTPGHSDLSF